MSMAQQKKTADDATFKSCPQAGKSPKIYSILEAKVWFSFNANRNPCSGISGSNVVQTLLITNERIHPSKWKKMLAEHCTLSFQWSRKQQ